MFEKLKLKANVKLREYTDTMAWGMFVRQFGDWEKANPNATEDQKEAVALQIQAIVTKGRGLRVRGLLATPANRAALVASEAAYKRTMQLAIEREREPNRKDEYAHALADAVIAEQVVKDLLAKQNAELGENEPYRRGF